MIKYEAVKFKTLKQIVEWIENSKKHHVSGTEFEIVHIKECDDGYTEALIKKW